MDGPADQPRSVGDELHRVVQTLADLGADAEGRERRTVPYPAESSTFADQLTVVGADLLAVGVDEQFEQLTKGLDAVRAAL